DLQLHRTAWLSHETGILEPRSRSQPSLQRFPAAETNVIGEAAQQSPAVAEACYPFYRKHGRHRPVTRREFITLAGPLAAQAQQPAMPVIGLLDQRSPDELADRLRGFRQGLRDSDFVEGQNVVIDYRWAQNKEDRLPELMVDFAKCLSRQVQSHKTAPQN